MKDFTDKVVVVTGGASGVGRALGVAFAKEKAQVVLIDIQQENLDKTISELHKEGLSNVIGMQADVTSDESMQQLAQQCFKKFGVVHVLFNNAGVGLSEAARPLWTLPNKDWEWGFAVNTLGAVNGIRAFLPSMIEGGEEGLVINTSSGNGGITSLPTTPIYAASKAALTSLTETLHYQLLKANAKIKAAVMFPGPHVINSGILSSAKSRPPKFADATLASGKIYNNFKELADATGVEFQLTEPEEVAEYTLSSIKRGEFWIMPDDYSKSLDKMQERTDDILQRRVPKLPE
jgi:NAD(P)-dependent dehydrogenase (short-subunit alcohol dehydrogenase family)